MDFSIETAKLLGSPDGYAWAQVHEFVPDGGDKLQRRGSLWAVILVRAREYLEGTEQVRQGREVLARLHEEYYGKTKEGAGDALGEAINEVINEFVSENVEVEIVAAVSLGATLHVGAYGRGRAYLLRHAKTYGLITQKAEKAIVISGKLEKGDVVLIGTSEFFEAFPLGNIRGALSNGINNFTETLAPLLHTRVETGGVGAMVGEVRLVDDTSQEVAEVLPERRKTGLKQKLVGLIDVVLKKLPERRIGGRGLTVRADTIDMETKAKRRTAPIVGIILLGLLAVSMFFGIIQRREKLYKEKYEERLTQAWHQYDEASELSGLNKARARELVIAARETAKALEEEGVKDERLTELISKIRENLGKIAGIYEGEADMFLDLGLITDGFSGDDLTMSEGEMVVLDKNERRVVAVDVVTKRTEVVAGPEYLNDALGITSYAGRVFVLSSDGVREVGDEVELLIKPDWDPGQVLMAAFAGNMYILEKNNGKIWRYPGIRLGFSEKQDWLPTGVTPDFSEVVAWSIDGSVWVLRSDGRVLLYSQGAPQNFSLSGLGETSFVFADIYTDEGQNYLYLLDKQGGRMMVFNKEGEYQGEYLNEKLSEAQGIVVSEEEKKLVFLAENKLWEIRLGGDGGS